MYDASIEQEMRLLHKVEAFETKILKLLDEKNSEMEDRIQNINGNVKDKFNKCNKVQDIHEQTLDKLLKEIETLKLKIDNKVDLEVHNKNIQVSKNEQEAVKELIKSSNNNIKLIEIKCEQNSASIKENKNILENTITDVGHKLSVAVNEIQSVNKKCKEYLSIKDFAEYMKVKELEHKQINERITDLHNNINPCALLKPNNTPIYDSFNSTPDAFLTNLFNKFHSEAKRVIEGQNEKIKYMESLLDTFKRNMNANLYIAAKNAVVQIKAKEKHLDPFPHNINDVALLLSKKSDASEIQALDNLKANKTDLKNVQLFANELNERIKYVVTMLKEFIDIFISTAQETKVERKIKFNRIAQQLALIYRVIISENAGSVGNRTNEIWNSVNRSRAAEINKLNKKSSIIIRSSPKRKELSRTHMGKYFNSDSEENSKKQAGVQVQDKSSQRPLLSRLLMDTSCQIESPYANMRRTCTKRVHTLSQSKDES